MSKSHRRAGQNIRELALKRRIKAIMSFASAGFTIFIPFFLVNFANQFMEQLTTATTSPSAERAQMPLLFYVMFIVAALGLLANGIVLWKKANRADQGAQGEELTGQKMAQLQQAGWAVEYNMRLGSGLGDADIVCISPQNKAYVIDVKSHRGTIITDGEKLCRRMGQAKYPFEKDLIGQVMKQAFQVKKQKDLKFVTPILAFSSAKVATPPGKFRGVYIVEASRLVSLLNHLG